jgi:hypothetical protein
VGVQLYTKMSRAASACAYVHVSACVRVCAPRRVFISVHDAACVRVFIEVSYVCLCVEVRVPVVQA